MKVGDKVYTYNENRRVYPEDKTISSGPIYREHFELKEIVGETTQSWIVGYPGWSADSRACSKHKKKADHPSLFSKAEVEEEVYMHDHAYKIANLVHHANYKTLKAIANLIGYKGESK